MAPWTRPAQADTAIKAVSYNIAYGTAFTLEDKKYLKWLPWKKISLEAVFKKRTDLSSTDILGVQEVCSNDGGVLLSKTKNLISHNGPTYMHFAPDNPNGGGHCAEGQAIVSRFPMAATGSILLPKIRSIQMSAVWADLLVPGAASPKPLRVYNLHLDNRDSDLFAEDGRLTQIRAVLDHIKTFQETSPNTPVILLGDFNALGHLVDPWDREKAIVVTSYFMTPTLPKYHVTHVLGYQLDWIFYTGLELERSKVAYIALSDHFPVVADFRMKD